MRPDVARYVQAAIAAGAQLDVVASFDDIAELTRLATAVELTPPDERLGACDPVLQVGDLQMRRLSMAAKERVVEMRDWFKDEPELLDQALVYALVNGRDRSALEPLSTPRSARIAIQVWCRNVTVPLELLAEAAAMLLPRAPHKIEAPEPKPASPRRAQAAARAAARPRGAELVLSILMSEAGQDEEYWFWKVSDEHAMAVLDGLDQRRAIMDGEAHRPTARQRRAYKAFVAAGRAFFRKWAPAGAAWPKVSDRRAATGPAEGPG